MRNNRWAVALLLCITLLYGASPASAQTLTAENRATPVPAAARAKSRPAPEKADAGAAGNKDASAKAEKSDRDTQLEILASLDALQKLVAEQNRKLEEQQAALRQQEDRVKDLERQLVESRSAAAPAGATLDPQEQRPVTTEEFKLLEGQVEAMADSANDTQQRVTKVTGDLATAQRNYDGKLRQLGNFRFSGDIRYRYEPFIQEDQTTRQRQRVRVRLNVQGNVTDTFFGGLTLSTGTLDDPISTNQTLGANLGFFNRFQAGFDRAWIQWTPKEKLKSHVTFGLGKFAYPWIRTPLTFDNDLNPNGVYTRVNWDFKNPFFKGITLVGMTLPIFERGGSTSATTGVRADGYDTNIGGAQLQTRWRFGGRVNFGTNIAYLSFNNPDIIAQAHSVASFTAGVTNNLTGNAPITNCVRTNASNLVVGYCSKFGYLNWVSTLGVTTPWAKWPVNVTFDFNNNVRATRVVQRGTAAPTGQVSNPERSAYWTEIQFGRQQERKDWQIGYVFARIERDALITAFNESDLRAGSNLSQHRFNLYYRAFNNVTLSYQLWLGHVVNANDPFTGTGGAIALVPGGKRAIVGGPCNVAPFNGCTDNTLKRQQIDIIYTF